VCHWGQGQVPQSGHQGQHNSTAKQMVDALTFHGRAFSRRGCLEHTEFSTVSEMVDPGGGLGECTAWSRCPRGVKHTSVGYATAAVPTEGDLEQGRLSPSLERAQEHTTRVWISRGGKPQPPEGQGPPPQAALADLQPSVRLQVF